MIFKEQKLCEEFITYYIYLYLSLLALNKIECSIFICGKN